MTWTRLTFGTAVLSALTLGTAIFFDTSRIYVKTEDIVELLEGISERQLALDDSVTTSTVVWTEAKWKTASPSVSWDGTNLVNGYWRLLDPTNTPTSYVVPDGSVDRTNIFISTGQYMRAWVTAWTNVGRVQDKICEQFQVTVSDPDGYGFDFMDGTYTWATSFWNNAGVDAHIWVYPSIYGDIYLVASPQDPYAWRFSDGSVGFDAWRDRSFLATTRRESQYGGSLSEPKWSFVDFDLGISITGSGIRSNVTFISDGETNSVPLHPLEFPARIMTNVANAVGNYNTVATMSYIDSAISGLVPKFVDTNEMMEGSFDSWFADNTNATSLPRLNMSNVVARLGPTVGINTNGSTHLLSYPARGTNSAIYGGSIVRVTPELLTARKLILGYLTVTERTPAWWAGISTSTDTNYTSPGYVNGGYNSDQAYTLSWMPGEGNALETHVTNQVPRITASLFMGLAWIHYPPTISPPEWWLRWFHGWYHTDRQARLRIKHRTMQYAESVHGYYRKTPESVLTATGAWAIESTNAISELLSAETNLSLVGFQGMSLTCVGMPYAEGVFGFSPTSITTSKSVSVSASAGPACVKWSFTRCVP